MARILFVTKDVVGFNVYHPLYRVFTAREHEVMVIAEGLSLQKWLDAGIPVYGGGNESAQFGAMLQRYDIDTQSAMDEIHPDVVMVELASPIHLGASFGLEANKRRIPLGFIEDLWMVHRRSQAVPDFICTLDEIAAQHVLDCPWYKGRMPKVHITDNPAMDALANVERDSRTHAFLREGGFRRSVVVLGQGKGTTPLLEGLVDALEAVGDYALIPRFHPKVVRKPENADMVAHWRKLLSGCKNGYVLSTPASVNTRSLMRSVDHVVSIHSNGLREAVFLGALPVSWISDIGRERMAEELGGLARYPLVDQGLCIEVSSPEEYLEKVPVRWTSAWSDFHSRRVAVVSKPDGKIAERVSDVIEQYL